MAELRKKRPGKQNIFYRDFDLAFRRHPVTGRLILKKDEDSVRQALKYLVLSNKYERPFAPEFGTDLRAKLFENMDEFTVNDIQTKIEDAIRQFEPRVTFDGGEGLGVFVAAYPDDNGVAVTIKYKHVSTLKSDQVNINIDRVR